MINNISSDHPFMLSARGFLDFRNFKNAVSAYASFIENRAKSQSAIVADLASSEAAFDPVEQSWSFDIPEGSDLHPDSYVAVPYINGETGRTESKVVLVSDFLKAQAMQDGEEPTDGSDYSDVEALADTDAALALAVGQINLERIDATIISIAAEAVTSNVAKITASDLNAQLTLKGVSLANAVESNFIGAINARGFITPSEVFAMLDKSRVPVEDERFNPLTFDALGFGGENLLSMALAAIASDVNAIAAYAIASFSHLNGMVATIVGYVFALMTTLFGGSITSFLADYEVNVSQDPGLAYPICDRWFPESELRSTPPADVTVSGFSIQSVNDLGQIDGLSLAPMWVAKDVDLAVWNELQPGESRIFLLPLLTVQIYRISAGIQMLFYPNFFMPTPNYSFGIQATGETTFNDYCAWASNAPGVGIFGAYRLPEYDAFIKRVDAGQGLAINQSFAQLMNAWVEAVYSLYGSSYGVRPIVAPEAVDALRSSMALRYRFTDGTAGDLGRFCAQLQATFVPTLAKKVLRTITALHDATEDTLRFTHILNLNFAGSGQLGNEYFDIRIIYEAGQSPSAQPASSTVYNESANLRDDALALALAVSQQGVGYTPFFPYDSTNGRVLAAIMPQSLDARVKEVKTIVLSIAVAIAALVAIPVVRKIKIRSQLKAVKRNNKLLEARAALESNPTPSTLKAYKKAKKKASRSAQVLAGLGIPSAATSLATFTPAGASALNDRLNNDGVTVSTVAQMISKKFMDYTD